MSSTLEIARDLGAGVYTQAEVDVQVSQGKNLAKSAVLKGGFTLSNTILQAGFATKLHIGNGGTQNIVNNINLKDNWVDYSGLSQWSAGTYNTGQEFFILDSSLRKLRVVCLKNGVTSDPNTLLIFTDATFSDWKIESSTYGGMVWGKSRSYANSHSLVDTIRGYDKYVFSDLTNAEATNTNRITSFNSDGFSLGVDSGLNTNLATYVSWTHQTTNVISGLTNHNKPYIVEYNPKTGFTQIKYEGSGLAGHEIPHYLGRELGFVITKRLDNATYGTWVAGFQNKHGELNTTVNLQYDNDNTPRVNASNVTMNASLFTNADGGTNIMYGYANSYFDDKGVLQGNYEIGVYGGTGASGNKIKTKGKVSFCMFKPTSTTGNWNMFDNQRAKDLTIRANLSNAGADFGSPLTFAEDGIVFNDGWGEINASGVQYLYFIVYDNDSGSGASKYPKASETSEITATNTVVSYSNGVDSNGAVNSIENVGSVTFTGINWDI